MSVDLRRVVSQIDGSKPDLVAASGFGCGPLDAQSWAWVLAELKRLGWTETAKKFGDGPRDFERAVWECSLLKPWTSTHAKGVRLWVGQRTDERFLGVRSLWVHFQAVKGAAVSSTAAPLALDLFSAPDEGPAPLPVMQVLFDQLEAFGGLGLNWAGKGELEFVAPDAAWQSALKAMLRLGRALPGWEVELVRERYHKSLALYLYSPDEEPALPEGFDPVQVLPVLEEGKRVAA